MAVLWLYYGPARYLRRCTEGDCIPRREGLLLLHLHKYDFQVRARVSGYGLGSGLAAAKLSVTNFTHSLTHHSLLALGVPHSLTTRLRRTSLTHYSPKAYLTHSLTTRLRRTSLTHYSP
jgi:hypothetical protein